MKQGDIHLLESPWRRVVGKREASDLPESAYLVGYQQYGRVPGSIECETPSFKWLWRTQIIENPAMDFNH